MNRKLLGFAALLFLVGCDTNASAPHDAAADTSNDMNVGDGAVTLGEGVYRYVCDGSASERIDDEYFFSLNDESQTWRIFRASANGQAVLSGSFGSSIGALDEVDIEGSTRVGDRIYVTGSHGRDKSGNVESSRYRFFAFDIVGAMPTVTVTTVGYTATLLSAMLEDDNYVTVDDEVLQLLNARSNLADPSDPDLAPTLDGVSIEALTALADNATLAFGFRNPLIDGNAIVITLTNAPAVLTGATPEFDRVIRMDLDGLGLRSMTYDPERDVVWLIAGPTSGASSPFALYRWSGDADDAPELTVSLTAANGGAAESLIPIVGTPYLRVLYDESSVVGPDFLTCKESGSVNKHFGEAVILAPVAATP